MTKKEQSRVRTRALVHMQALLAVAATESACHTKDKTTDAGSDATAFGPPSADAGAPVFNGDPLAADPDASVVSERNHGYAVVDPMPRPAHCPDVAEKIKATATKSGEEVVLRLSNAGGYSGFKYEKTQIPTVYNGTYVKHSLDASGTMVITMKLSANTSNVSVKGTCNKGAVTISASFGPDLHVYVNEY